MTTIMTRWRTAKERLAAAMPRVAVAIREAGDIVSRQCGQTLYDPQCSGVKLWVNRGGVIHVNFNETTLFLTASGEWVDGIGGGRRPLMQQHISTPLRKFEAFVAAVADVNTGGIIAAWEQEQQGRTD